MSSTSRRDLAGSNGNDAVVRVHCPVPVNPGNGREFNDSKKIWDALKEIMGRRKLVVGHATESPLAPVHEDAWEYNMKHLHRGKAIIFNHKEYDPSLDLSARVGTEVDRDKLIDCLTLLGFHIQVYNDLTFDKLRQSIESVAKEDHKNNDCLMVIVLSHGKTDLLYAHDMSYNPEVLWDAFTAEKCSSLAGKPKMFFIQACRGEKYDDGTHLQAKRSRLTIDTANKKKFFKVPNQADFLIVFSCVPGHYSWRNHIRGSWFIQAVCKMFSRYHENVDVLNMITLVNQEVATKYESNRPDDTSQHGKKQVPHVTHTLLRQIHFTPKKKVSTAVVVPTAGHDSWV